MIKKDQGHFRSSYRGLLFTKYLLRRDFTWPTLTLNSNLTDVASVRIEVSADTSVN